MQLHSGNAQIARLLEAGALGTCPLDRHFANTMLPRYKQAVHAKEVDVSADTLKASLIDTGAYTFSSAHTSYASDVAAGAKIAASSALTSPTETDGVLDTADFVWAAVSGAEAEGVYLWDDTITSPADLLMVWYDTGMTGMPVTPSGGDISFTVNGSGWYAL